MVQIDDYDFLKKNKMYYLVPWIMQDEYNYGSARVSNIFSINKGLTFRDSKTSIKETHDWWYSNNLTDERRAKFEQNEKTSASHHAYKERQRRAARRRVLGFMPENGEK